MPASSLSRHSLLRSFDSAFSDLYTPCVVFGDWKGLAENRTSWVSVALGYVGAVGYCPSFRSSLFRFRLLPRLRLVHICGEGCTFTFSRLQSRRLWEGMCWLHAAPMGHEPVGSDARSCERARCWGRKGKERGIRSGCAPEKLLGTTMTAFGCAIDRKETTRR